MVDEKDEIGFVFVILIDSSTKEQIPKETITSKKRGQNDITMSKEEVE